MKINNQTKLNLIVGYPLDHTQSPVLHNFVYERIGLNAVLLAFPHQDVSEIIATIKTLNVKLTAVTLPFKEKVLPLLDQVSDEAKKIGAVNTIVYRDEQLYGLNTDVAGIAYAFSDMQLAGKQVLVLGAGGAARAALYYLNQNHANSLIHNRTHSKAVSLAQEFAAQTIKEDELAHTEIDVIINTTPIGMFPHMQNTPVPHYHLQAHQIVFDMIYNPMETLLIKRANAAGCRTISGLDMFIGQGIRQIEICSGQTIKDKTLLAQLRSTLMNTQSNREHS